MSEPPEISFSAKKLRQHWVCHFGFWDGPLDGLVEIDGLYYYAQTHARGRKRNYTLYPIVLTDECQRFLKDYRKAYPHTLYADGVRPAYFTQQIGWFHERWPVNPIREIVKERTS